MRSLRTTFMLVMAMVALPPASSQQQPGPREDCRIESDGRATGPGSDICENLARRWSLLLPTAPSPGIIRIAKREGYGSMHSPGGWVLEVPMPDPHPGDTKFRASDGLLRYYADDVIPHEAGHQMFMVHFRDSPAAAVPGQYGSVAPDWFDEAPAIWMESQGSRARQLKLAARANASLATLVTMAHPTSKYERRDSRGSDAYDFERRVVPPCAKCTWLPDSLRRKYRVTEYRTNGRGRADTIVWYSTGNPNNDDTVEAKQFYPLSYSLLRFIRLRGGAAAVRELIARYREDPTPRVAVLSALPGLPASVEAFERAWHEFLGNPPPEDK